MCSGGDFKVALVNAGIGTYYNYLCEWNVFGGARFSQPQHKSVSKPRTEQH